MDPVETVLVDEDTTFDLMLAAEQRGHAVYHALVSQVFVRSGEVFAKARPARARRDPQRPIELAAPEVLPLAEVDAVFVRKDPPFDSVYLWTTLLLEGLRGRTLVLNDPRGLRDANEKLFACRFPELNPETLISADKAQIRAFIDEVGGEAVIKPIDGHGGEGVFALRQGDFNINPIVEALTRHGQRPCVVQRFLPAVRQGDKRILLLDGEALGAILRVPRSEEFRSNIHVGGSVVQSSLDADDRRIVETLAPVLREHGLYFVGLDVIGGKLTEVNVTSPTGIQQMSRLDGQPLSERVITWVEARVAAGLLNPLPRS